MAMCPGERGGIADIAVAKLSPEVKMPFFVLSEIVNEKTSLSE